MIYLYSCHNCGFLAGLDVDNQLEVPPYVTVPNHGFLGLPQAGVATCPSDRADRLTSVGGIKSLGVLAPTGAEA